MDRRDDGAVGICGVPWKVRCLSNPCLPAVHSGRPYAIHGEIISCECDSSTVGVIKKRYDLKREPVRAAAATAGK